MEMRTLIPACLLSQPNSLIVSPALRITSLFTMYSLYSRLLDALCNHAAPQSNSSYSISITLHTFCKNQRLRFVQKVYEHNFTTTLSGPDRYMWIHVHRSIPNAIVFRNCVVMAGLLSLYLVTVVVAVKRANTGAEAVAVRATMHVSKLEHLPSTWPFHTTVN